MQDKALAFSKFISVGHKTKKRQNLDLNLNRENEWYTAKDKINSTGITSNKE